MPPKSRRATRRPRTWLRTVASVAAVATAVAGLTATSANGAGAHASASIAGTGAGTANLPRTPDLTASTFADPPATVRPKYFWWMPLANTDDSELAAEVHEMARAGAGGALIVPQRTNDTSTDFLAKYGWGTPLWRQRVEAMLAAAHANGVQVDFSQGPAWPAVVPSVSDVNDPRAMQQLIFSYELDQGGTTRTGPLPSNFDVKPPTGADKTLVGVVVARCESAGCSAAPHSPRLLDRASVQDVTSQVADGELSYTLPGDASDTYAVLAFYQTATGASRSGLSASSPNYFLDYLSVAGAKATTDYFDSHIITPQVQDLINAEGGAGFYDNSLELGAGLKWTWGFADDFQRLRGYSLVRDLPALSTAGTAGVPAEPSFDFGGSAGTRIRYDYLRTLSDLYIDNHLGTFRSWAHSHNIYTRAQPYGPPIDMAEASANIDVPGGESLAFGDDGTEGRALTYGHDAIDDYKIMAVGAHVAGTPIVSAECCALRNRVWSATAATGDAGLLAPVYNALAGGATRIVWHGFPYLKRSSGSQSVWPGMSYGGNTSYAAAFGPDRNPNWADYRQINDDVARLGLVLRQGKPRFDVAVYWEDFGLDGHGTSGVGHNRLIDSSSALASAGYTYEYLSPSLLQRNEASYRHGRLFPDRSAYHALVLNRQTTMPVAAARKILGLAEQGLPVVIIGSTPVSTPGLFDSASQDQQLRDLMTQLVRLPGVVQVDDEADVPGALQQSGVRPAAAHASASSSMLTVRRHSGDVDYYFVYNQTPTAAAQTLTLRGAGVPYRLDTWTGKITPIGDYDAGSGGVSVPVDLAGHDAEVIAVTSRHDATFRGGVTSPPDGDDTGAPHAQPVQVGDWSLSVDSWTPGPTDQPGDTAHTTLGPVELTAADDGSLPPWSKITPANGYPVDLGDVSGIGTYTANVRLDNRWNAVRAAYLDLGAPPVDTTRVIVNGHELAPLDQLDLRHIDVGRYLRPGANTIQVRVSSTLLNAVRVAPGTGASGRDRMDYGLFGPVTLTPYSGASPYLTAEPLAGSLSLANGGFNRADILATNHSPRPVRVTLSASTANGISATIPGGTVTIGGGQRAVVPIDLRDSGVDGGTSVVAVIAQATNGTHAQTTVTLRHSDDLALNATGAPYPRVFVSGTQGWHAPELATDTSASTFWVSNGVVAGQGPTPANPVTLGVDLGAPTTVTAVQVMGHSTYGPTSFQVQTSSDKRDWTTVADEPDVPATGTAVSFPAATARYVRLVITDSGDSVRPPRNVHVSDFAIFGPPTAGSDLMRRAQVTASSTHSGFSAAAAADGLADSEQWVDGPGGGGWNDGTFSAFPDTLTGTWSQPVAVDRVRIDTLDSAKYPAAKYGVRDVDVQAQVAGGWQTVAAIRQNTDGVIERSFPSITTSALRLVVLDSNSHDYSRIVEVAAYGSSR